MTSQTSRNIKYLFILLSLVMILGISACVSEIPTDEPVTPLEADMTAPPTADTTAVPSATPSPELPVVLLIVGPGADPWRVDRLQSIIEELSTESGLGLVVQEGLEGGTLAGNVRVLVGIGLDLDPAALAASNPGTAFAFVGQPGAAAAANLSLIGDPAIDQQRQSFMAGYLAALVSSDYKVAGLIPAGHPLSDLIADAFVVGAEFFCGVCNPLFPPFENYPQWQNLAPENAIEGFQPVVDALVLKGVEVLYLHRDLATSEMLTYLAENNIKIVGDGTPDSIRNQWVGTVATDPGPALIALWPDLIAGIGGAQRPSSIVLMDQSAGLVSDGRLRMFEEMVDNLEAGLVAPATSP